VTQTARGPWKLQGEEVEAAQKCSLHLFQLHPTVAELRRDDSGTGKRGSGKANESTAHNTAILSCSFECTQSCSRNQRDTRRVDDAGAGLLREWLLFHRKPGISNI
jgi:hypothetical protein